jgi:hypothetical protein
MMLQIRNTYTAATSRVDGHLAAGEAVRNALIERLWSARTSQ